MKTIGLIGGMSWESSQEYYRIINEEVRTRLGGLHSAQSLMYSVDFELIEAMQRRGQWKESAEVLGRAALSLERGGADFIVLCTNTMHKVADEIQSHVRVPLLHIADCTGERLVKAGVKRAGLLGTRFTMEEDFYKGRITKKFGVEFVVPEAPDRKIVDDVIFKELCLGTVNESSRKEFNRIIAGLARSGAEAVVLGCTEIFILVRPETSPLPVFDTTRIHAETAVRKALE